LTSVRRADEPQVKKPTIERTPTSKVIPIDDEEDLLPDLHIEDSSEENVIQRESQSDGFNDVEAFERDMSSEKPKSALADAASSDLLVKIASELSGIKSELISLKKELASIKAGESIRDEAETDEAHKAAGGFFDDEEDETIALTGDELDNILNTADFTEENAEEFDDKPEINDEILLPEDGSPIEPIGGDIGFSNANEPDGIEAIEKLREEGVVPTTPAIEDLSYLDEDASSNEDGLLEIEDDDVIGLDSSDENIGEIHLAEEDIESIESEGLESFDDLTLEVDAAHDVLDEAPVDLVIEPIEEIESFDETDRKPTHGAEPVGIHPEQLGQGLDDDLFVSTPPHHEPQAKKPENRDVQDSLKKDIKNVLSYLDKLLDSLPEEKIEEFARSEYFDTYKKLFEELGLV
jgi:hypothetical protein